MFQICSDHQDVPRTCYFFKVPMEMRLRIYRLLLPDIRIPARRSGTCLRESGEHTHMEILRVNRQIHDEATSLLYGTGSFSIEISANGLSMSSKSDPSGCATNFYNPPNVVPNGPNPHPAFYAGPGPGAGGNHQLQDYQMQLMLLEQQNKKRLLMARQAGMPVHNGSSSIPPPHPPSSPTHPPTQPFIHYPNPYTATPSGPVWDCPLPAHYFNLIHHFHITLIFPTTNQINTPYPLPPHLASTRLYTHSDLTHSLIGRLLLLTHPISTLSIRIKFFDTYSQRSEAIYASQFLLRPFRRLANIVKPEVSAVKIMSYQAGPEIDILPTLGNYSSWPDDANLLAFLSSWTQDLKSEWPAMPAGASKVFDAYWKLESMVRRIQGHYRGLTSFAMGLGRLEDLLGVARVCREDGDEAGFEACWGEVVAVWLGFLEEQRSWESGVEGMIDGIMGLVGRDATTPRMDRLGVDALGVNEGIFGKGKGKEVVVIE